MPPHNNVEKVAESLSTAMASVVLAASNHASFTSSIWSGWAGAPHDLLLVTEVSLKAVLDSCNFFYGSRMESLKPTAECFSHCLPILLLLLKLFQASNLPRYLKDCLRARLISTYQSTQVVLTGTSIKAVAAVRDLVYTGACLLDEVTFYKLKIASA